jgi:succinate dehydrogenase / fumarate reductase iron-sulfur subunit
VSAEERLVRLRVRRQDAPDRLESRRWDEFQVPVTPRTTVLGALLGVQANPVTADGREVAPPAFESGCLEDACGACAMLIDGRARQACSTRIVEIERKGRPIVIEPLGKFPLVRDLVVDRTRIFDDLRRVEAFVRLDASGAAAAPPGIGQEQVEDLQALSRCTSCGACLEACPVFGEDADFVGAAALSRVALLDAHPVGALGKPRRLELVMAPGGVADCGKAHNCVEVCPAAVPTVDAIQQVSRDASLRMILGWFLG